MGGDGAAVESLARERYLSLTTFRRTGAPVATAVWVVRDGDRLFVHSGRRTGKVRRIRNDPSVTLAPCTMRGRRKGPAVPAVAAIVPEESDRVEALLVTKYGLIARVNYWFNRRRNTPPEMVAIALTLGGDGATP